MLEENLTISTEVLLREQTDLNQEEMDIIMQLSRWLPMISDISQADVFIDCPLSDKGNALIVAQSRPSTTQSLYNTIVVGQKASAKNEPAVLHSLLSGQPVIGSRGVSQEQKMMEQNVVPIKTAQQKTIGVLILERDISAQLKQAKNVEILKETTEQLSEALLKLAMTEGDFPSLMHEGIILFDEHRMMTYTNAPAFDLLVEMGFIPPVYGEQRGRPFPDPLARGYYPEKGGVFSKEVQVGSITLQLKLVTLYRNSQVVGGLALIRDISELKEKEKQLMIKSAVIKEMHHRVKNNLQTISSLLRLQMRRTEFDEVKKVYRDSIARINSVAVIHEILAHEGNDSVNFKEVISQIAKMALSSMTRPGQNISISVSGEMIMIPSSQATTLALVVNEIIHNSVIHAFPNRSSGEISVELYQTSQINGLQVRDNGVGIGKVHMQGSKGQRTQLGLNISETLVREDLQGVLELHDTGEGTITHITFPAADKGGI